MRAYNSNEIDLEMNLSELRESLVSEVVYDAKKRRHAQPDIAMVREDDVAIREELMFDEPRKSRIR